MRTNRLALAGLTVAVLLGVSSLALHTRPVATQELDKNMPTLSGDAAVKYLEKDATYGSLVKAMAAIGDDSDNPEAVTKIVANDGLVGGYFGSSIAISGDTVIVGAPKLPQGNGGSISGAAYIFVRNGASWSFQQKLTAPDAPANNGNAFGDTVGISGDTVVVAAPQHNVPDAYAGAAYVFVRTGTSWALQKRFTNADTPLVAGGKIGFSVAISGDTVLVTAFGFMQFSPHRHLVHVFVREGTTWTIQETLITGGDDSFSTSIAISGNMAIVGNPSSSGTRQDAAYIFVRCGMAWTQQQRLTQGDGGTFDGFGSSVAISGNTVIVGAPKDLIVENQRGSAYIFATDGTTWTQQAKLTARTGTLDFGTSVAILGDTAIVGVPVSTFAAGNSRGEADLFVRNATTWTRTDTITASDGQPGDWLGFGVAISSDSVFVGAPFDDFGSTTTSQEGSAYIIDRVTAPPPPAESPCEDDIEVNITSDLADIDLEDHLCDVDMGQSGQQCSLRAAIQTANAKDGPDEIIFDIPGGGIHTISPMSVLPPVTEKVSIDATTQPGYAAAPLIELRGSGGNYGLGFMAGSNDSLVSGLAINRFQAAIAFQSGGNRVERCYIGLGADGGAGGGTEAQLIGVDLRTAAASNNTIGGVGTLRNVISDNGVGVAISLGAPGNKVFGNRIGTNAAGATAIPNVVGVFIDASSGNKIGDAVVDTGNLISGNTGMGIFVKAGASNNLIAGNKIGTNATGTAAIANPFGIRIEASSNNTVGTDTGEYGNLISGNTSVGVVLAMQSSGNQIKGNMIGTNAAGSDAIANAAGVVIDASSNNRIGDDTVQKGNLISANTSVGVVLQNNASGNIIGSNKIGTTATGLVVLPNGQHGVFADTGATQNILKLNVIGGHNLTIESAGILFGPATGPENSVFGNFIGVAANQTTPLANKYGIANFADSQIIGTQSNGNYVSRNEKAGIWISSVTGGPNPIVENNLVKYNFVGTNGTTATGNTELGIWVNGAAQNNTVQKNIVSGNGAFGIVVADGASTNSIKENFVGTNTSGTTPIPNGGGIWVRQAINNTIESNLVSGNSLGILVGTNAGFGGTAPHVDSYQEHQSHRSAGTYTTGNQIFGNVIGLNAARTAAIAGSSIGMTIGENARNNLIGSATGNYNLVSGNTATIGFGILLGTLAANPAEDALPQFNTFQGNVIGLAGNLQTPISNKVGFVLLQAVNNTIGGTTPNLGNTIVASTTDGLQITDGSRLNTIQNNRIGVLPGTSLRSTVVARVPNGTGPGNDGEGIKVAGTNATGNQLIDNFIANSGRNGILIGSGASGTIIKGTLAQQNRSLIADNGANGVKIVGASDVSVLGTIITRSVEAGVFVDIAQRTKRRQSDRRKRRRRHSGSASR